MVLNAASHQKDPLKSSPKIEMDWELSQIFFLKSKLIYMGYTKTLALPWATSSKALRNSNYTREKGR